MKRIIPIILIALVSSYKLQADTEKVNSTISADESNDTKVTLMTLQMGQKLYSEAMDKVAEVDPDMNLLEIMVIQDQAAYLLKQSLDYVLFSNMIDPKNDEVKSLLNKLYIALNNPKEAQRFSASK